MTSPQVHIVTGKWASGKTTISCLLATTLQNQTPIHYLSDRIGLEDAAMFDYGYDPETGTTTKEPVFSEVNQWGPPGNIQFTMSDGFALQIVREQMVSTISDHLENGKGTLIAEVAVGPNVPLVNREHGILFQTTEHLIFIMENKGIKAAGNLFFYQLEADMQTRLERQGLRGDPVAEKAFSLFAGDGGELIRHENDTQLINRLKCLECRVTPIDNGHSRSHTHLAELLGATPINAESIQNIYQELLAPSILIRTPQEHFQDHPLRKPEGNNLLSSERR